MSEEFLQLINKQQSSYEQIKSVKTNYYKDSVSRKSIDYLNKRIDALQSHWDEFRTNNDILKKFELSNGGHEYFQEKVFNITSKMYEETIQSMSKLREQLLRESEAGTSSPRAAAGAAGPQRTTVPTKTMQFDTTGIDLSPDAADEHIASLLRTQMCNFSALERAVSKIKLDEMKGEWQLRDQLNILRSKWDSIDKIHWELAYLLQGSDERYEQTFDHWEKVYDGLRENINKKMFDTAHYEKTTPRIDIPEFNGEYNNWVTFRDLFYETVHENPTLNNAQKMKFLKSKLRGEAEKLIKHLPVSADNYESCLNIIQHRYDNRRLLFKSYLDTLLNQPTIEIPNLNNLKRLHDTTKECLNGLESLDIDVPVWGPLIVYLLWSKLDDSTYNDYLRSGKNSRELPDLYEFIQFIEEKFMALETARTKKHPPKPNNYNSTLSKGYNYYKPMNKTNAEKFTKTYHTSLQSCPLCKKDHALRNCTLFQNMDIATRNKTANELNICKNCLFSHGEIKCNSKQRCRKCNYKHHSLLHDDNWRKGQSKQFISTDSERSSNHVNSEQEILLTTLQLQIKNKEGNYVTLRALLDQGSQVSLITENAAQRLNLPRNKINAAVTGVGTSMGTSKGMIRLECKSIHSDYTFKTEALIMRKLVNNLPNSTIETKNWTLLDKIELADPHFNVSGPIDLLFGADIYSEVIVEGVRKQNNNSLVAQQTKLGWILSGATTKQYNCCVTLTELDNLSKFWDIEEIPSEPEKTTSDQYCEEYFTQTTERLRNGRYVVKMPMNPNFEKHIGNSKAQAIAQFRQLEKKMAKQEHFATLYKQFICDYMELGHMKLAVKPESPQMVQVYLPHHGVLKPSSTTSKLRTVFNASMKTDSGYSLNDLMEKGPNLQKDILTLIIRWRTYKYVIKADIEKMYRQILIHQDQHNLQNIIWRNNVAEPLKEMQLCTLTYGTKVAPYLAIRVLLQLANDDGQDFPLAQKALREDFFMDDLASGHHTIETTMALQKELYELLNRGGFHLRKWSTNEPSILENIQENQKSHTTSFQFTQEEFSKTLGLIWNNASDSFHFVYAVSTDNITKTYTKRRLLSEISKIYDPLGWLSPMTIRVKLIFQKLWSGNYQKIGWDENVPENIVEEWNKIKAELPLLNTISLPRWNKYENNKRIELQAFCDASEHAYACVIYSRVMSPTGAYDTTLLAAKTKVAPINKKISIPRLELCAAVLLTRLLEKVKSVLTDYEPNISCWTDSKVVLAWIQGNQSKYEKYVTNRTAYILNIIPAIHWGYVKSNENPADCATRGLSPSKLVKFSLWWDPQWPKDETFIQQESVEIEDIEEGLITNCYAIKLTEPILIHNDLINSLLERHSNLDRILRILAWVMRFADALKHNKRSDKLNELHFNEINNAFMLIIKSLQSIYFANEIKFLTNCGKLSKSSSILKLNPFLDPKGILRVGGRLEHSSLSEETKHPILIPSDGRVTKLIVEKSHQLTLHGGARLTLAHTRNKYWIVSGNRTVKKILRQCVRCRRYSTARTEQLMGNLPKIRITPSRPFLHTGVDFTGHVEVKINKGRGIKTCKGYIAVFICMSTKAVHIELVSDMSTQTFIAALKRMCARRGTPKYMYSDNGTNFVGAAKILKEEFIQYKTILSSEFFKEINDLQIEWRFNCPLNPAAGGIWEAAIRGMKFHLKRVIGHQKLTYEQFSTLLTQIEACMNSRPLSPLSEDVADLNYLTPGHFLTGGPTLSLPLNEPEDLKLIDPRNHWKLIELMRRHYWNRWSKEYLHTLQNRDKWQHVQDNIQKGQLVLVKENNLPPGKWAMGRVLDLHPGTDNLVRVVTLKTQNGEIKRPITKLAPLPVTAECESTESPSTETVTRKKPKSTKAVNSVLMVLLVFCMNFSYGIATAHFKQTNLSTNLPIYFDSIGNIQVIHDEWKLLVYYNITTFWESTGKVEDFVNHLNQICATMPNEQCHSTLQQLKFDMNQLNEYNTLLLSQHQQRSRKRRGYVNGVGNLARTLFGVLDSEFAEKYARDIGKIQINEQHLLQLIKNQTLIVEAENNIIKKNEAFVCKQMDIIQRYMNETNNDMELLQNRFQIMKTMNDVNAGAITTSLLLSVLRRTQQMLLNALTDIHRGHLDMNLFTPEQLWEQLNYIAGTISKRLTLPVKLNNRSNIEDIYKLIYVKARLTEQYLLLELHIPLLSDDEYTLYNTIPIHTRLMGDQCQAIATTTKYIGVNFAKNIYLQMSEAELQQCTLLAMENYICHAYTPIRNLHGATASCEAKMLSQTIDVSCDWIRQPCSDQWIKLQKHNTWLYNCIKECRTRIVCENQISSTTITNTGLLTIGQDCVIQYKDATIYSQNVFSSKINTGISLEVPTIGSPNDMLNTYKHRNIILPKLNLAKEHMSVDDQITTEKREEHLLSDLSVHDIGNYTISLLLLVGGIAAVTVITCRWRRQRRAVTTTNLTPTKIEDIELQDIARGSNEVPDPTRAHTGFRL